jgi:hypothetical protein
MANSKPQHSERETVIYDVSVSWKVIMAESQNKSYYSIQGDMCVCLSVRLHNTNTYSFVTHLEREREREPEYTHVSRISDAVSFRF